MGAAIAGLVLGGQGVDQLDLVFGPVLAVLVDEDAAAVLADLGSLRVP
jgi:hypothetical protein